MTQITVNVLKAVRQGSIIHLEVQMGDYKLVSDVTASKIDTPEKLALWLLSQPTPPDTVEIALRKRLVIDFHQDNGARVLDGVVIETLPEEKALGDIAAIPNWATWTVAQAHTWINENITGLPAPVMALFRGLAQMSILERDAIIGLKRRGE